MTRSVSRRKFIRATALGSAGLVVGNRLRAQIPKEQTKPNLIIFLPDELRADTIVGAQAGAVHAPNLHQLAAESVIFDRAYVTQPICAPSRSSLLSGTWPHANGCTNNKGVLPRKFLCLPEMIGDSDYNCAYFGKWHLGDEFLPQHGFSEWASLIESFKPVVHEHHTKRRLEEFFAWLRGARISHIPTASDYTAFLISKGYRPDAGRGRYFSQKFGTKLPFEASKPKFLEIKACDFLERHHDKPFVMFVAFFEPHPPYTGPFNNEHPFDSIQLDSTATDVFGAEIPLRARVRQENYRKKLGNADGYRRIKQNYFGLINEIDRCIGTIREKVKQLKIDNRTITVLTSDHGDMMSAHGLLGKGLMYEQSAGVPYLVQIPGQNTHRISQPVSHIDFVPTMLDLLNKPPHSQCAGKSRASLIRGESQPAESVFLEWSPGKSGINPAESSLAGQQAIADCLRESTRCVVSADGWKLSLRDKDKNDLYNLHDDPDESRNLYYTNTQTAVISRLTEEIHAWQQRTGDSVKV
jgi:arylsulfatase A-like enzyme